EDNGDMAMLADLLGCIDTVDETLQPYVHQHQFRLRAQRQRQGVLAAGRHSDDHVADPGQLLLDVPRDHPIVFDNEYPGRRHGEDSARPSAGKVKVKIVPSSCLTAMLAWSCCVRS